MENEKYKYACDKCNYYTNISASYKKHLETELHKSGKRKIRSDKKSSDIYVCDKCNFTSKNEYNYKAHVLNYHSTIEERKAGFTHFCESCNFGTYSQPEYNKHIETNKHKMKSV